MDEQAYKNTYRILLVDDQSEIHDSYKKILSNDSSFDHSKLDKLEELVLNEKREDKTTPQYSFESAYQGQEALEKIILAKQSNSPFALCFLDVRMPPGWDGITTYKAIKKVDPDLQFVICSAYSDYSWEEMHREIGLSDNVVFLRKPFDSIEIQQLSLTMTHKWWTRIQAFKRLGQLRKMLDQKINEQKIHRDETRKSKEAQQASFIRERDLINEIETAKQKLNILTQSKIQGIQAQNAYRLATSISYQTEELVVDITNFYAKLRNELDRLDLNTRIIDLIGPKEFRKIDDKSDKLKEDVRTLQKRLS